MISTILTILTSVFDLIEQFTVGFTAHSDLLTTIFSFAMFFLYFQMLYYLRLFRKTAQMVRMVIEITKDMKNFLLLMLTSTIALAHWEYIYTD